MPSLRRQNRTMKNFTAGKCFTGKMMNYPPACYMEAVLFAGNNEKTVERCSDLCAFDSEEDGI